MQTKWNPQHPVKHEGHQHKTCQNTKYKTVGNPQNLHPQQSSHFNAIGNGYHVGMWASARIQSRSDSKRTATSMMDLFCSSVKFHSSSIPTIKTIYQPNKSFRSLLTEEACLAPLWFRLAAAAGWEKLCGLKKGLPCIPNPPATPPRGADVPCSWVGAFWVPPNGCSHVLLVPVGALGPIWLRETLGGLGLKRLSRADMSEVLFGPWCWVKAPKFGVLFVVAMPP